MKYIKRYEGWKDPIKNTDQLNEMIKLHSVKLKLFLRALRRLRIPDELVKKVEKLIDTRIIDPYSTVTSILKEVCEVFKKNPEIETLSSNYINDSEKIFENADTWNPIPFDIEELKHLNSIGVVDDYTIDQFKNLMHDANRVKNYIKPNQYSGQSKFDLAYNLELSGTGLESLPDNLQVRGALTISYSKIKKLPDNLIVNGIFRANGSIIKELPENSKFKRSIFLSDSAIEKLPENLSVVGDLKLTSCRHLTTLPDNLSVSGSLMLNGSTITTLPKNLVVGGDLDVSRTPIINNLHREAAIPGRSNTIIFNSIHDIFKQKLKQNKCTVNGNIYFN